MELKILYHGTSTESANKIIKNGFNSNYGRFGTGIYLSEDIEECLRFGQTLIKTSISGDKILVIDYIKLADIYSDLDIEEEEGCPEFKEYAINLGYKGIKIVYDDGSSEVCIYDNSIVKSNKLYN